MTTQASVDYLLSKYGQDVTFKSLATGTYDTDTGQITRGSSTDTSVKCYFANYTLSEVDGSNIIMGDRKAFLPAGDITPKENDTISGVGDDVKVVSVDRIYNGSTVTYFMCQVRE